MRKLEDINGPEMLSDYLEGCLNDMEAGIMTKEETLIAIRDCFLFFMQKLKGSS